MTRTASRLAPSVLALLLVACGSQTTSPSVAPSPSRAVPPQPSPSVGGRTVEPAPDSESAVYAPNPEAVVVAIDAGHGGCLDWGVPDPSERGVELSEKVLTLQIARRLRDLLTAEGIGVVMIRDGDEALAGDLYPELGCEGPRWRDVNGDGESGFDPQGSTRTRDELQARLDLANLAAADALVSIHINSPSEGGRRIEIAFSETFYTDETPWGGITERLADAVQRGVVDRLAPIATYDRGDRGVTAHNFYLVAPPLVEPTAERPNRWAQPTRGGLMPVVLAEVGSITLRQEHDLLASAGGQEAVARGLFEGLATFFAERDLAARIAHVDGSGVPEAVAGDGPPFWPSVIEGTSVPLRITNTGTDAWPDGGEVVAGWETTDEPYLAFAPERLEVVGRVPPLAAGETAHLDVVLPEPPSDRSVAWISLRVGRAMLADHGSPPLQLSSEGP